MTKALIAIQMWMSRGRRDDRGASLVEYALLVALIALVCFAAVGFLGDSASAKFNDTGNSFANMN